MGVVIVQRMKIAAAGMLLGLVWVTVGQIARADEVTITASLDTSLYEGTSFENNSNGKGVALYAGPTLGTADRGSRRALLFFDIAGNVPEGATIESATVTLQVSYEPSSPSAATFTLNPVSAGDWGEGSSDAGLPGGKGAAATLGDATWKAAYYDPAGTQTVLWNNAGGDFHAAVSGSVSINGLGSYDFVGEGLTEDVQDWLDTPAYNLGWILRGNEAETQNAREFHSRESETAAYRPTLTVQYVPEPSAAALTFCALSSVLALRARRS